MGPRREVKRANERAVDLMREPEKLISDVSPREAPGLVAPTPWRGRRNDYLANNIRCDSGDRSMRTPSPDWSIALDIRRLDSITPVPYKPVAPQMDTTRRQIILGLLITGAIIVVIVAIGILAQVLHNVVR